MDLRIITYNVNGLRAAIRKGFLKWLQSDPADIICLQEIKAGETDVDRKLFEQAGYQSILFPSQRKGYSGVAILSKKQPDQVEYGHQNEQSDFEGRVLRADYGDLSVISAYFPSGSSGEERQTYKYQWMAEFHDYLKALRLTRNKLIVCGDYNIAHKDIDIHNPKSNKNSSGFLPDERAWMDKFFADEFVDGFRYINGEPQQYTWWHQLRKSTRLENKGWRIDYISVSANLCGNITDAAIFPFINHSDHCPVRIDFRF